MQFSASGQKITDVICGSPPDGCSPSNLVNFLGDNPQSPFVFKMNITDTPYNTTEYMSNNTLLITPVNTTQYSCSKNIQSLYLNATACGCSVSFLNFFTGLSESFINNHLIQGLPRFVSSAYTTTRK